MISFTVGKYFAMCVFVLSFILVVLNFTHPPDLGVEEDETQTEPESRSIAGFKRTSGSFSALYIPILSVAWVACPGSLIYLIWKLRKEAREARRNQRAEQYRRQRSPMHRRRVYSVMDVMAVDEPVQYQGQGDHYL